MKIENSCLYDSKWRGFSDYFYQMDTALETGKELFYRFTFLNADGEQFVWNQQDPLNDCEATLERTSSLIVISIVMGAKCIVNWKRNKNYKAIYETVLLSLFHKFITGAARFHESFAKLSIFKAVN